MKKRLFLAVPAAIAAFCFLGSSQAQASTPGSPGVFASNVGVITSAGKVSGFGLCDNRNASGATPTTLTGMSLTLVAENADGTNRRVLDTKVQSNPAGIGVQIFPGDVWSLWTSKSFAYPSAGLPSGSHVVTAIACTYVWHSSAGAKTGVVQGASSITTL